MERPNSTSTEPWSLLGNKIPWSEIVYFCQMIVVYIMIITSRVTLLLKMIEMIQKVGSDTTITKHPSLFKIHEEKNISKGPAERIKSGKSKEKDVYKDS